MSIGKNIAKYRKSLRLTQEAFGENLGVTNQAVSKWESEASMPDIMLLPKISAASDTLNMDCIHNFPKDAQAAIVDSLYRKSNLPNCHTGEFLKAAKKSLDISI